ncbi:MAG TPA: WYL domain-containing protein [Ktedonobacterales bacterium]|jgi:predicted DNA-binding transcriptional regulator YafY|nr:WYL domain-containing protein [Ktedonobacterales bacterium]
MKELDRILGILLILQSRRAVAAKQLAERFSVSTRTIYRDLQTMSLLGIPIYTERGRKGGIRLLEGYFLPPLMFSQGEAIALLLGLLLLRNLRAVPFGDETETASHKLLTAVPEHLRVTLARLERVLGVERYRGDMFSAEPYDPSHVPDLEQEGAVVTRFLQALLDRNEVHIHYRSPYRASDSATEVRPLGAFWDRERWYLVGDRAQSPGEHRLWRADRVLAMAATRKTEEESSEPFDIGELLGHSWLKTAMDTWRQRVPVRLRITAAQAKRLQQDWYYRLAQYDVESDGSIMMSFGEDDPELVLALMRWLGPGAELLSPEQWKPILRTQLETMLRQAI